MENENYYQHNLETGKLNIYSSMAFYKALDQGQRKSISDYCLWSNVQQCWVSKAKAENCGYLKSTLGALGFRDAGAVGERLPFATQQERKQQRAAEKVKAATDRAKKASDEAGALLDHAGKMVSHIPLGQPILVGHHREKRDRRYREKIHKLHDKAFDAADKAKHYKEVASAARQTAEGTKYLDPKYLEKKIKACTKSLEAFERNLKGQHQIGAPESAISDQAKAFYTRQITEMRDQLEFFTAKMKAVKPDWTPGIKQKRGKSL